LGETLDKRIKDHNKKGHKEKKGRTVGVELLNGEKIFGTLENSRTNVLLIRDFKDNRIKDVHRAIIKRFLILIKGGGGAKDDEPTSGIKRVAAES
jgi:hypothetical protein